MTPYEITSFLHSNIIDAFAGLDCRDEKDASLLSFHSSSEEWNIGQIIEHVALANRYLIKLIDKGGKKALRKAGNFDSEKELAGYALVNQKLEQIGINNSFEWGAPEHMRPAGRTTIPETRGELLEQKCRLLENLSMLKNGEGVLHKTSMSVHSLGKLDVYQYIYFLVMHMKRHVQQMEKIKSEYAGRPENSSL